ncbi:MAG: 3-methyl-2-oxobutanoate hydroxymethyltransferase [Planctomycetota bacterium]|nr:3-methyl-2-oxobutanoate hydroxymethyltransferase [Planctomycetota bacterium]MEC8781283.1 3-methyl-2-oxobutanoate hydroxymethyltransferase [Planctomycetota bacterium]
MKENQRITVPRFTAMKQQGRKISMLTAYDFPTAKMLDEAGVDSILVGDTLAMVIQGQATTLPVTLDEMIYHGRMVSRAVERALVIVDLPFPTNHLGIHATVEHAARILKETEAQAVKLEGGADQAEVISALVNAGIPVMGHVGLRPQSVHTMGGFKVQRDEEVLLNDAKAVAQAGAFGIVLECIPAAYAKLITEEIRIPTIGIGAGADCDGQVLVINDMLGLPTDCKPRFVKTYANLESTISDAVKSYCRDVQEGSFPGPEHTFAE